MASFYIPPEQLAKLAKENESPKVIALVSVFTGIGLFSVILRFFTRVKFVGFLGLEDYFIAISTVGYSDALLTNCDLRLTELIVVFYRNICMFDWDGEMG